MSVPMDTPDLRSLTSHAKLGALNTRILEVRDLQTFFFTPSGVLRAVDGVSLAIERGRTLGIVGESGCGKSVTALSIMRLISPPGHIVGGEVWYQGRDLLRLREREMRRIRGKEIALVFQEPMTSLNPVLTLGVQIGEAIKLHQGGTRRAVREKVITALRLVEIPEPERRLNSYPHELSGGMRQRVMIAMALSCSPLVLIADEPTTALDVTIQAQILDLLAKLREQLGMAIMLITHDLGLVAQQANEVVVMYAGKVVERAPVTAVFDQPLHPYTVALLHSVPQQGQVGHRLESIPGSVPDLSRLPAGCAFRDRCPRATGECAVVDPPLEEKRPHHWAACIRV